MTINEWSDATAMAQAVQNKTVSPRELVDAPSKVNVGSKSSAKSKSSGSVFGKTRRSSGVHS